jgi:hypothetical protein
MEIEALKYDIWVREWLIEGQEEDDYVRDVRAEIVDLQKQLAAALAEEARENYFEPDDGGDINSLETLRPVVEVETFGEEIPF